MGSTSSKNDDVIRNEYLPISVNEDGTEITDNHTGNIYVSVEPQKEIVQMMTSYYGRFIENHYMIHDDKISRTARITCKHRDCNYVILNMTIVNAHMIIYMVFIDEYNNIYSRDWIFVKKDDVILM